MFPSFLIKHFSFALLIAMPLCSCDSKPNSRSYTPTSKKQVDCLSEYRALEKQEMKDEKKIFLEVMKLHHDDEIINFELASRRSKEKLCMIKADCYEKSKGIEFSDCVNDVVPHYED